MWHIIQQAIDWTSVELNAPCLLLFITGNHFLIGIAAVASISTIVYNGMRIYKELKKTKS